MKRLIRLFSKDKRFFPAMVRLALPIALQNLLSSSLTLVDTLMIGELGDLPLASVGMAGKWSWLMTIVFFGFTSGAAVFIAQNWGARDEKGIRRTFGVMSVGLVLAALLFTAGALLAPEAIMALFTKDPEAMPYGVEYLRISSVSFLGIAIAQAVSTLLRSTEQVKIPVFASLCSVLTNAVLNYVFIFGKFGAPAMGVAGAALATALAAWVNALIIIVAALAKKTMLRMRLREALDWRGGFVLHYFKVSLPALINESLWALGTLGYDMVFGHMGTENFAALTIARTVQNFSFVFLVGVCNACAVHIGKRIGAGEIEEAKEDAQRYMWTMIGICVVIGLAVIALCVPILSLFNVSARVRQMAMALLVIYAAEMWIRNISYIAVVGIFRAGGDTRIGVKLDIITVWFIALPLTYICGLVLKMPFVAVYAIMLLSEDIIKDVFCLRHLRRGEWIRPVTTLQK